MNETPVLDNSPSTSVELARDSLWDKKTLSLSTFKVTHAAFVLLGAAHSRKYCSLALYDTVFIKIGLCVLEGAATEQKCEWSQNDWMSQQPPASISIGWIILDEQLFHLFPFYIISIQTSNLSFHSSNTPISRLTSVDAIVTGGILCE